MWSGEMMYRLIRTIHLYAGLVLCLATAMYAFSGFVILHGDWFEDREAERKIAIKGYGQAPPEEGYTKEQAVALAAELVELHGLRGRPKTPQQWKDGTWFFAYQRPGVVEEMKILRQHRVEILIKEAGFAGFMNRLHHFHGYGGGRRFWLWGLLVDVTSAAMILFAASGVYMWYVLKKDRRLGWVILGGSTAYALGSILFLVYGT